MPGIGFIPMYFFLVAISQAILVKSSVDAFDGELAKDISIDRTQELLNVQGRTMTNVQECSCSYDFLNGFVKARVGHRRLKARDSIMRGETASFECRYVNTVLKWENGLRFYGRANMTCNTCEKWRRQHLPTCISAQQIDVVLGQEDDLAVLPGGTVQLQAGQTRRFSCSNIWGQPEWVYPKENGVYVLNVKYTDGRETIFVSNLEIPNPEDRHSGVYECFSRSPAGHQTLSTFLHIEVVRNSENNGTTSPSPGTGVSPTKSTTSVSREIPDDMDNRECSCVYYPGSRRAIALVGDKRLLKNDTIRHGDTVSFSCGKKEILSWMNGLRYHGKAHMTCSKCEVWTDTELPSCRIAGFTGPGILGTEEELSFLPGGILHMREGESRNITCISSRYKPRWVFEAKDNVVLRTASGDNTRSYLEIKHAKHDNKGKYKCANVRGAAVVLELEVDGKSIDSTIQYCSQFPLSPGLRVVYSGFSVGSTAQFRCSPSTRKLKGSSNSTCLEDGTWSNPAPMCNDSTIQYCSQFPLSPGLRVVYSGFSVGSTAQFRCSPSTRKLRGSSNSTCLEDGTWSNAAPMCDVSAIQYCSEFPLSPGLRVEYSGFSVGSTAQFRCSPSTRKLRASSNSTCLEDGTWSNPAPMCDDPKCSVQDLIKSLPMDVILDTLNVIDEFSIGSEVQLKCEGLLMEGDSTALCGEYGRWQVDNIICVPGCRLDVNPSSELQIEPRKNSYRTGEFIFLSCPAGYHLSSDVERLMCLFNRWSSALPECIPTTF